MTRKMKVCKECGRLRPHYAYGLCSNCYKKQNLKVCEECGELKPHHGRGYCQNCYNHKMGKSKPMSENKSCSAYLGIVVAEKLLSKVFKDVKQMPNNNKGFDFKCNKGMKIDVKSSVLQFNKRRLNHEGIWYFSINENKIADYFICIAFDNREDTNPLHLWLIPAEKINHLQNLGISKITTDKWSEYEKKLDKTIECCDSMKS